MHVVTCDIYCRCFYGASNFHRWPEKTFHWHLQALAQAKDDSKELLLKYKRPASFLLHHVKVQLTAVIPLAKQLNSYRSAYTFSVIMSLREL